MQGGFDSFFLCMSIGLSMNTSHGIIKNLSEVILLLYEVEHKHFFPLSLIKYRSNRYAL